MEEATEGLCVCVGGGEVLSWKEGYKEEMGLGQGREG